MWRRVWYRDRTIGREANICRRFRQHHRDNRQQGKDGQCHGDGDPLPPITLRQHREQRQENELACGIGRGQQPHGQPVALGKPAIGDCRGNAHRTGAGADAYHQPPCQE